MNKLYEADLDAEMRKPWPTEWEPPAVAHDPWAVRFTAAALFAFWAIVAWVLW
jgi:hypothetical protein